MAAWASACPWNFTKAQPATKQSSQLSHVSSYGGNKNTVSAALIVSRTFAGTVRPSQHSALVYAAEGFEQPAHILVALLLSQHANKQLPVL